MMQRWTPEEDAKLIALLSDPTSTRSVKEVAVLMGRPHSSVKHRGQRLGYSTGRSRIYRHPDSFVDTIVELRDQGLTQQEIADRLGVPRHCVSSLVRKRGKAITVAYWTPAEDEWIKTNYPDRSVDLKSGLPGRTHRAIAHRAHALGVRRPQGKPKGSPGKKRIFDEAEVCQRYRELGSLGRVAAAYKSCAAVISRILRKHGIVPTLHAPPKLLDRKDEVIADYKARVMSMIEMGVKYGVSDDAVREQVVKWGAYDPKRKDAFVNRRGPYDCWVDTYGKEEADRRRQDMNVRQSARQQGKGNHMYGKPTPQGAGNGWKGWYKSQYFRSLREVSYMLLLDQQGVTWSSAESVVIPYVMDGVARTYRPDYLVGNRLVEIKPKRLHSSPSVTAKRLGAEAYCSTRNMTYELIDAPIDAKAIHAALLAGDVRFDRDYEARFLTYIQSHSP